MEYKSNELPRGWVWTRLGEITNPSKEKADPLAIEGTPYIGLEHIEKDTARLINYGDSSEVRSTKTVFHKGDILYGKLRPYLNKVHIAEFDGVCSTDILVFPKSLFFSNKYISFRILCGDFVRYANQNVSGVQHPRVNFEILSKFNIPLPPLPEQHRIVVKIEELFTKLDAGIEALKKIKAQLKRYRQAVLKYAFEGKLTQEWREANKGKIEPVSILLEKIKEERKKDAKGKFKKLPPVGISELPELPEGWVWTWLGDTADFKNGINFNKNQKGDKGILTVDVLNMYSKGIFLDLDRLYRVNKSVDDEYLLKYGDVLFVRSSVKREGVGWASAFKEIAEPVTFCGFIIRARLQEPGILPEYVTYFLRANFARELIVGKGSQVTITNI